MKTNRIFLALSVATALLCASCSNDDETLVPAPAADGVEWKSIPFEATVSDGDGMRATLDSKNKYVFEAGDKLIVAGENIKGELTLKSGDEGKSSGVTFEGELEYTGGEPTAETALTATLVSSTDGIHTVTDKAVTTTSYAGTLCATRAEAVQQLSDFQGSSTYGDRNFSLSQKSAFLDFTVTMEDGTAAGTSLTVSIKNDGSEMVSGNVTTETSGSAVVAHFIAGLAGGTTLTNATVQLDSHTALSIVASKEFAGNKFYNVARTQTVVTYPEGALGGQFTIDASGTKVVFSQGNLQAVFASANATTCTWQFAANQYDYIGNAAANTAVGAGTVTTAGTVDLFGWVGASSTWTDLRKYGICNSTTTNAYGNVANEDLKNDWGSLAISNGGNTANSGWRTLTSAEWTYLFNTRSASTVGGTANARYAKAQVNSKYGVILFPDSYTHPDDVTAPTGINATGNAGWNGNSYTTTDWAKMEAAGAVFLPAAGYRNGTSVLSAGSYGYYWSSSPYASGVYNAYSVYFYSDYLDPSNYLSRKYGQSVRLVRMVE